MEQPQPEGFAPMMLPLFGPIAAGFAAPVEEQAEETITIEDYLVRDKASTFLLRVKGDSMINAGIHEGDLVVVERGKEPRVGDIVVGAGNIYACEALFSAGIDPRTRGDRISRPRCERLATAIRDTLAQALALGGSTLRNFRDAHGMAGEFQSQARVYGRAGEPCHVCGTTIRRVVQGQRATFFCPSCQRR